MDYKNVFFNAIVPLFSGWKKIKKMVKKPQSQKIKEINKIKCSARVPFENNGK
jgi:hypothetical protein